MLIFVLFRDAYSDLMAGIIQTYRTDVLRDGLQTYRGLGNKIAYHYENMPIQIYWKFYHQKMKIFR